MCMVTFLSNCAYALIAPFFPLELKRAGISKEYVGPIFSVYSVAVIICSPLIGLFMKKYSRRSFIQFGLIAMSLSMFGFSFASYFNDNIPVFLAISLTTRFIQGFSSAAIQTVCFSISAARYRENQAKVIGLIEMQVGIGLTISPVIGAFLYGNFGYKAPFFFFGSLFAIIALFVRFFLPKEVDHVES